MKINSKPLRYAHAEGHTDVCYSDNGQNIITCGHDGDVRIWVDIEDDDPSSHCVGESAVAVCFKDKRLYVATDNHAVQAYTFPAFDKDGIVTRFTAPVTQVMMSKAEALACASENMEAKICSPEGGSPLFIMTEHKGPVLSVALCPNMKYASTACGDGLLRIWDIDTQKNVKEITCVPKINTFFAAKVLCRMDFEPVEGKYLAYPNNKEIVVLECGSWSQRMSFTHSLIKCAISQCAFSPCGRFLAGSTVAGQIAVWDVQTGTCIDVVEHPTSHNVSALAWNPKGNGVLIYCDVVGQLGMLVNCYGEDSNKTDTDNGKEVDDDIIENLIENYESDDDNAISLEKLKNDTLGVEREVESRASSRQSAPPAPALALPQPPFQPSATSIQLEHRYMCWNDVGIVRCHTNSNGESNIDVEFHDTNVHHGINLNNYLNHTMASLSTSVLALACETPSKLVCITLVGSSKEWSVSLPDGEEACAVAAGAGAVALATTTRLLRLYTPLGTQRQVICMAGPVVALGVHNTTILSVYHGTDPGPVDQHLAMDVIALNGRKVRSRSFPVPLSAGGRLRWVGASDAGSPCTLDTTGRLRLLDLASALWMPVCDTNDHCKSISDTWFIVSVSEPLQTVRGILCRGTTYPQTVPKPIITEIPIQIPLCELDTEKGQYEEQLVRWAHTTSDVDIKTARETALKLFALACRSEIEQRALELMELLRDERLVPLAAKYASRLGRMHLADRLSDLGCERDGDTQPHSHEDETQETADVTEINTSLILQPKVKEKKEVAMIRPVPIKSSPGGIKNPFKKHRDATKIVQSPLSLTDRNLVDSQMLDTEENEDPLKPKENETFINWFSRNKPLLEDENPELMPSELTRYSVKKYKEFQTKNSTDNNKRKLDDSSTESPVTSAPKQSKLSAFAFSKRVEDT